MGDENALKYLHTKEEKKLVTDIYDYKDKLLKMVKDRVKMRENPDYKKSV